MAMFTLNFCNNLHIAIIINLNRPYAIAYNYLRYNLPIVCGTNVVIFRFRWKLGPTRYFALRQCPMHGEILNKVNKYAYVLTLLSYRSNISFLKALNTYWHSSERNSVIFDGLSLVIIIFSLIEYTVTNRIMFTNKVQ